MKFVGKQIELKSYTNKDKTNSTFSPIYES